MLLTRVRPSIYLPVAMALWGTTSACTALVKDFTGLVLCRFILGFMEAPFFPGALFFLSCWYTRKELATRTAVLYFGSLLSSAFGGLFGAAIQYGLDGFLGLYSWQWLFILEGTATVGLSVFAMFILPDFPSTTKWLSEREKAIAMYRLRESSGSLDEKRGSILAGLRMAVTDYKVWLLTAIMLMKTSAAAVVSFIPTLVATFAFSNVQSLLMVAPPYVFAAFISLGVSISSDKLSERYFHLTLPLLLAMIGFLVMSASTSIGPRYTALFLILGGLYGGFNVAIAWVSSTVSSCLLHTGYD